MMQKLKLILKTHLEILLLKTNNTMKKLILFLFFPFLIYAQTDSVKVRYSEETVEKFEEIQLKENENTRLVKSALRATMNLGHIDGGINIEFEQKIGKEFSIIGNYGFSPSVSSRYQIEPRWYFNMKERVNEGLQKPNVSGHYLSMSYRDAKMNNKTSVFGVSGLADKTILSANIGRQFANILDFQLSVGFKNARESYLSESNKWKNDANSPIVNSWFIHVTKQVGIGFLFPKYNSKEKINSSSPNYTVKQLWKFSFENFYFDKQNQSISGDISYERRIKDSYFTTNSMLSASFSSIYGIRQIGVRDSVLTAGKEPIKVPVWDSQKRYQTDYSLSFIQQIRYYPLKAKDIRKGKSGLNFNGLYVGPQASYRFRESDNYYFNSNQKTTFGIWGFFGLQHQFSNKFFFDYGLALKLPYRQAIKSTGITASTYIKIGITK